MAEANIATARADYEAKAIQVGLSTANWDVQIASKQLELSSSSLKTLEEQLANSQYVDEDARKRAIESAKAFDEAARKRMDET